jgi:glycosyltransferase involved in cell wall biosynthesis
MFKRSCRVHIINPFWDAAGGSEWRGLSLYRELRDRCRVSLWSEFEPSPLLLKEFPIKRIIPRRLQFPLTGTFVFVGVYFRIGSWIRHAFLRRVVLVYNTNQPQEFFARLRQLSVGERRRVEVVYASEWIKNSVGYAGEVQVSLIDIERFVPRANCEQRDSFTVGRMSRDAPDKHHTADADIYRALAAHGCRVRIMGAAAFLSDEVGDLNSVTLLPTCAEEPHAFLQSLDCFFYRTSDALTETWGRVVTEAMAAGLPVVCHRSGGYTEVIEHERNGFLFETQDEALAILLKLREDRALRDTVGCAARATAEQMFSRERRAEVAEFYCPAVRDC